MTDPTPEPTSDRDRIVRAAYQTATAQLREKYLDEFRALQIAEAAKHGVTYKPRPTADEKAEATLAALLADNPGLKARLVDEISGQQA